VNDVFSVYVLPEALAESKWGTAVVFDSLRI